MGLNEDAWPTLASLNAHVWMQSLRHFDAEPCDQSLGMAFRSAFLGPVLNQVFLTQVTPSAMADLQTWVSADGRNYTWNVPPHQEARDLVLSHLASLGLVVQRSSPQYTLSLQDFPRSPSKPCSADVKISSVESPADVDNWTAVFQNAFGMPDAETSIFKRLTQASIAHKELATHNFLLRFEGRPVTIGTIVRKGNCGLLVAGATLDGFRGRGFGEAMLRHRIEIGAALGVRHFAVLTSSPGSRVYAERSGFRQSGEHLHLGPR